MNDGLHENMDDAKEQKERENLAPATLAKSVLADLQWLDGSCSIRDRRDREAIEDALENQRELVNQLRQKS